MTASKTKRYALVGCGSRGLGMFAKPISQHPEFGELVGLCDPNHKRMAHYCRTLERELPQYTNFAEMLEKTAPDAVIVTTKDGVHHQYIIAALEAGCDVITEKPMTIDAEKCRAILAAEKRTHHTVTVTFNYRFAPYMTRIKEVLREGRIGRVLSIDFHWFLDRKHGADYFRRWHRRKENSGGLLVHKATHHFDMVNWFLDSTPKTVWASGTRLFYGPTRAERGQRCLTCDYKNTCEFYWDIEAEPQSKALYRDCEDVDGYFRDACVFADEIDIEDTMAVTVEYESQARLSYSLIAHAPYEGWQMNISGVDGRLELFQPDSGPLTKEKEFIIRAYDPPGEGRVDEIHVSKASGGHGGGDERLQRMLFLPDQPDPLGHMADSMAGAMSILTGIAANRSIATGQPVHVPELLSP